MGGAVRQRGPDDPRLQAQRTQGVELVTGKHDDALRLVGHVDGVGRHPRRVVGGPGRGPGIRPGRLRCTLVVWPARVAQNARPGDLGGAGDHHADPLRPGGPDVQPPQMAAEIVAAAAAASVGRIPLSGTRPTLTSGRLTPAAAKGGAGEAKCSPAHYDSL